MRTLDRRIAAGVAVLAAAFSMSFAQTASAAPAGGGHWDDLGSHEAYYQSEYRTKAVKSAGGAFQACITSPSTTKDLYNLYEQDAEVYNAKLVTTVKGAGCWVFRNIGAYVDGNNHRAEFYIGTEDDPNMMRVHYYD
ncbi:hypothetical protein [Streptomyces spinosisporus]|uniref:Uncharacterized protein n=1 Tax=Streptomyces spinosisporus TaxID=2927582 RepID=A0ABS9XB76_9ACTN|nr:hypothetical protein [Streptomyces spinosisporus]MCI3239334.1 hypothetical protein [Streptomyces spinosisporus]